VSLCSVWRSIFAIKGRAVFVVVGGIGMHRGKKSGQGGDGGAEARPLRTSDRLRRRPKIYGRAYLYYNTNIIRTRKGKGKNKTRTAASQIAKMLCVRTPNNDVRSASYWLIDLSYIWLSTWMRMMLVFGCKTCFVAYCNVWVYLLIA